MNNSFHNTVLVAEDNADVRELLRVYLEMNQFEVVEAKNGEEAIKLASDTHPDLILMDLNMPEIDGIKAVEKIRQKSDLADIPILVNSAYGDLGMEFFLNADKFGTGYIEYLAKPLNYIELANSIKSLIENARANLAR